jgi:hypothetical protein
MLQRQTFLEQAGMLMQGVKQLQALEDQTSKMLSTFQHWSQISDSKIQRTENKVNFLAEQRKMILDAKATLGVGQQLLRGNPEQLKMVDMALDYLEDDTSRTLGEIREFSRYTDKLLTNDQIESGAAADDAAAKFAEFNQKLLDFGQPVHGRGPDSYPWDGYSAAGQSAHYALQRSRVQHQARHRLRQHVQVTGTAPGNLAPREGKIVMPRLKPQAKLVLIVSSRVAEWSSDCAPPCSMASSQHPAS